MKLQQSARRALASVAYAVIKRVAPYAYAQDGLATVHSHDFLLDPAFQAAYARGLEAVGASEDYQWHWRIHVGLWAASLASKLPGDFIECGVNKGFLSSAVMRHLDWDRLGKTFYLLDTFNGVDTALLSADDLADGALEKNAANLRSGFYVGQVDGVRKNFAEWERVRIVQGSIPNSLSEVHADQVAYLHIDMNCAAPEVAALTHFWHTLVPGAVVLLDDYAYFGFQAQKEAMDSFAVEHGVSICSLPTGQGLLFKPPLTAAGGLS